MAPREGSLEAPTRHPLDWKSESFYDKENLFQEMERIFDLCHGCRRCVSLCNSFPTLFNLVDESDTMEVDGVKKEDYWKVVDHCYLCDLCYMTKCPYIPPHEWNLDFPHVMLRAKAVQFKEQGTSLRNKMLSATDTVGGIVGLPVVAQTVNFVNSIKPVRKIMEATIGISANAKLPKYESKPFRKRFESSGIASEASKLTRGKVALFATCYGNRNEPGMNEDLVAVLEHNGIPVELVEKEQCCGMPKLELGDLDAVEKAKEANIPMLAKMVDEGFDLMAAVPSCVLMFKQELPLMFPDDADVQKVKEAIYDPFEYLMLRHKDKKLKTEFPNALGKVSYHVACHLRVQNMGFKTRDILNLIPSTEVLPIERCSGHDGTYAVKKEFNAISNKICRPVVNKVKQAEPDHYTSDCMMAGHHIEHNLDDGTHAKHPMTLLRMAYDI